MTGYDFGYSPLWTHGHLMPFALAASFMLLAVWRRWPAWVRIAAGLAALWALAGFAVVQFVLQANRPVSLPTEAFLPAGGEVLDVGAGSGRSTVMVLLARPAARVTALDIYQGYFGIDDNTPDRLRRNAAVAGAEDRVEVVTADMRRMPFGDRRFDGAVSVASIDHLNPEMIQQALAEVARVLKDNGEFLLVVINVDGWVRLAYPFAHHGYFAHSPSDQVWRSRLEKAHFEIVEQGTRPALLYLLARKGAAPASTGVTGGPLPGATSNSR
jgi:ubiquinone/menaquinone biosynthesis C-methylase UbiE